MAEDKKIVGRRIFSETEAILGDDGYWKIVTAVGEGRTYDGEEWDTLFLDAMSLDDNFDRGYQTTITSAMSELYAKTIERGFSSLFDADAYDKAIEKKKEEKDAKTN